MSDIDPSFGRDAELHQYAISDLSVEEQLAGGASVDDLVAAGVLHDEDQRTDFPSPIRLEDITHASGAPMSEEEIKEWLSYFD